MPTPRGPIKAISFDADGTLWDFEGVMRRSLSLTLHELRRHVPARVGDDLDADRLIRIRDAVARELKGTADLARVRLEGFRRALESIGVRDDALAVHLNAFYLAHRYGDIQLYPDVLPALDALRLRYPLGLITNGNTYPDRCGLAGYFTFCVFAEDHGVEKPDPRLFEIALREAGCAACGLLHVGDSLATDVRGAMDVGARAVWLNRDGAANDTGVAPDDEIATLHDLPALVARIDGPLDGTPSST